ncbi:MAG: acyl-CoA synthetase [Acidimicrobiia bacterium]|nr:acyl-CoA synthetase [Acidimicrobiia bacterium]
MTDTIATGFWAIAADDPERLAVADPDHRLTSYGELAALTNRLAGGLQRLGLSAGDQLTVVLPNSVEQIGLCLAAFQTGLYLTTVNWHLAGPEIAYIIDDSETKAFVVDESFAEQAGAALAGAHVPTANRFAVGDIDGFRPFAELADGVDDARPGQLTTGSYMFYTSGTTGRPKGVRRPLPGAHPDEMAKLTGGLFSLFGMAPHDGHVHIAQAPLYHTAVNNWALTSLHLGHPVVLMDRWTPEGALDRYQRYRVTQTHMVPTMFHRLLAVPEDVRAGYDVSSLRCMVHAAAPCPVETKWKMLEWWGDVIWEYYAATEGGGTIVSPQEWRAHPGTVGRAWPISEVIVVDDDANRLAPGKSGTIYMKMNTGAAFEYYKDDEKTAKARLDDYFTVGDVGYFDDDGFLYLNDRSTDMVIVGGVNIYPAEIEGALHQCDLVADVAVFGVPDDDTGEAIKAVIEPVPGIDPDDDTRSAIMEFLRDRIAKQKWPRSLDFIDDMPRDPNGKLYKRRLRDPYWEGRERAI